MSATPGSAKLARAVRHVIELLEQRVLLAATPLDPVVTGTSGNDVMTVRRDAARLQVLLGPTVIGSWDAQRINSLTVDGLAGDDLIVLADAVGAATFPHGGLVLSGGAGADTLSGPGGTTTWLVDGPGAGTVGAARFGAFENLRGAAGNNDSFAFEAAGSVTGIVDGGAGGFDVIELRSGRFRNVVFTTLGPTSGTIARDDDVINYTDFEPILDATGGAKTFTGTAGKDEILLDLRFGDDAMDGILVSSDTGEDVIFTDESETTGLTINTGGGDDDVRLSGIVALTGFNLRVDTGTGDDHIRLDDGIVDDSRNITLIGGDDFDELEYVPIDDFGDVTLTDSALQVTNPTNTVALGGIERALIETIQNKLNVDGFTGQVVHVSDAPRWGTVGPGPYSSVLDGSAAPWDPAAGAINAIAVDPNDRFTTYLGTVNGGIWRNTGSKEVFFDVDQSSLTADDMVTLNAFSDFLENFQRVTVEIAGHTDSSGDDAANMTLSRARAESVRDYLVNVRRVDPARLRVVGYGEDRPVAENIGGRQARNRRVELLVENWQPLTDDFPSLSISSIAVSPLSSRVIYAGIGRTSSFRATGGVENGLLVSVDGGDNWRVLAAETFRGLTISQVVPTTLTTRSGAREVYVSTYDVDRDANGSLDDLGGLFTLELGDDGTLLGDPKISGAGDLERGLPAGHYTDLVVDPGIPGNPQRPVRVYAGNPASGIYQLTDGADFMWHAVNTGFTLGRDSDANGADDLLQRSSRIKFALHPRTGAIYAAVLGPVDGTGLFSITGQRVGLIGLYKSEDFAASWAAMPLPQTTDNGTTYGLHAGRNGDIHFSIAVDPTDEDVVYLGGDRQGATTNNSAGLASFAGRLFVFDDLNQAWVQIVGNNTNGTAPHADSRGMVFTSDYTLLEIDDGGLYRLQNPAGDVDQGRRRWTSENRQSLVISEVLRLAYDTVNDDLLVGTQDNGSAMQGAEHDHADNDFDGQIDESDEQGLWTGTRGDGNSQAVIPVDTTGDSVPDRVLRYSLHNTFNDLQVREFTSAGVLIDADGFPRNTSHSVGLRRGPGAGPRSALNAQDAALTFDLIPMVVNANDPTRMLIGYHGIYESINTNINPAAGQARVLPLDEVRQVHPALGTQVPAGSQVTALVYGGTLGGAKNNDLIIASRGNKVLIRQAVGQAFSERVIAGAGTIRDLKADPKNWKTLYAIDSTDVYRIDDVTDLTKNWVKITANLRAVGQYDLRALEFIDDYRQADSRSLLVGGAGGVSRLFNPGVVPAREREQWVRLGRGLPNAPVFDILWVDDPDAPPETRQVLSGSDEIFVATLGRGVWHVADILGAGGRSLLQVYGAATADQFKLIRDPANPLMVNLFDLSRSDTDPVFRPIRGSTFDRIEIYTRGGDDTLTLDHSHGAVQVPQGIRYDGGEVGSNSLVLKGEAYGARQSGTDADGKRFELVLDLKDRRQYVRLENVASVKDAGMPRVIDNGIVTIEGAMESLVETLTFRDELLTNLPVFGSSVGRALNGVEVTEPAPVSTPGAGAPPLAAEVVEASTEAVNLLRRFIEVGKGAFAIDRISEFTTLAQLQAAFKGLDESGAGVVTVTGDLTNGFEIGLAGIKKRLSGRADLSIRTPDGKVDVSGLVDVSAEVTLNLVFGVDEAHGFYIRSNPGADVVVDAIRVTGTDNVVAGGRFGFLGVDMTRAVVAMDPAVRLSINIQETGGDGFIQLPELLDDPGRYVGVSLVSAPGNGVNDVTLTGTFSASAIIPGTPANIPLFDANVELRWADLANPTNVTLNAPAGSTGAKVLEFLSVTGPQVIDQLKSLRGHLDTLSNGPMHIDLSVVQDVIDDLVNVVDFIDRKVVDPIQGGANAGRAVSTIQEFVATLAAELGIPIDSLAYDVASGDLTYRVTLAETLHSDGSPAGLHFELPSGLSLQTSASAAADGNFNLDFVFGINVKNIAAGGSILDNVFLNNATMGANVAVNVADLDAAVRVGFLEVSTSNGTTRGTANVSLALKDPNSPTSRRLTMRALGSAVTARPLDLLVGRAPSLAGSASVDLRNITVSGLPGVSPAPGAFVRLGIADLRAPGNVTSEVVGFDSLFDFNNLSAADVLGALSALCDYLASLKGASFMSAKVPFTSKTLGDVVDFKKAVADGLISALTDPQGKPAAKSAQALADKLSEILGLPPGTINAIFDAATKVLTYHVVLNKALAPVPAPIQVSGSLGDVAVLNADTMLSLGAGVGLDFVFGADFSRRTVTITATADAPANGRITADAHFRLKVGAADPVSVTVRADATNASIDHLVADVNAALSVAGLAASVVAGRSGNRLTLSTLPGVTRPRITLNATATDTAVTQLRFADGLAATDDVASRFFVSNASVSGSVTAAANNVRLGAKLGFIDIGVNNGSANLNAAVSLTLQPPGGPAGGKVTIPQLASAIVSNPGSVVASPAVTGSARMDLPIVVEGGVLGTIVGTPQLAVRWADVTDPATLTATFNADALPLLDFKSLSFADVLNALKGVAGYFTQLKTFSFLNQKLPLLNKSVTDLIDFATDFADKVEAFEQDPAGSLQDLKLKLAAALGLPTSSVVLGIEGKVLKVGFDFSKNINLSRAVNLDLAALVSELPAEHPARGFLQGITSVLDVSGSANLALSADALVRLNLGLDFTNPISPRPFVYNTTGVTLGARASGINLNFTTALGPLGAFVKGGSVVIDGDGNAATATDKVVFTVGLKGDPAGRTYLSDLGTDDTNVSLAGQVKATLPLYFPTQSSSIGNLSLAITNLANIPGTISLDAPDLKSQAGALDLLNNLGLVIDGLDLLLAGIQSGLNKSVFSHKLPLIGDSFSRAGQFVEDFRGRVISELHAALDGAGDKAVGLVQDAIFNALGPTGLKLLQDVNSDSAITRDDVPAAFRDVDGNGVVDQVQFDLTLHRDLSVVNTPIDFDAGLPGLGLDIAGNVQARLSFDYALSFGVSSDPAIGFYVDTGRASELAVRVQAGIPGLRAKGKLGPLTLDATDSGSFPSNLSANFTIDLVDPPRPNAPPPDNRLTYNEVSAGLDVSKAVTAKLAADANVNLGLVLGFGNSANFPSFASDFELKWHFDPADGMEGGVPTVAFKNVRMDLGSFVGSFVGPVLGKVSDITAPLQPFVDFVNKPIPVLSDVMGKPTTVLDLANSPFAAAAFGASAPADTRFISALAGVARLLGRVPTVPSATFVPLGAFDLAGVDVRRVTDLSQAVPRVTDVKDPEAAIQQTGAKDFFNETKNVGGSGSGLRFPILSNPSDAFRLIMGQDVDLVTYDMAPLALGFKYGHNFGPVPLGPLPVAVTVRLGAAFQAFANLSFGFDTKGVRDAVESGNPADAFGGFYLKHRQGVPELGISGSISAAGEAGVVVADFGLEGTVKASLSAGLRDVDKDGKVYLDEFVSNLEHGLLCTFDVTGKVTAGLNAYVTIGFWPIEDTTRWEIAERTLVDWQLSHDDCYSTRLEPNDLSEFAADIGVGPGIHLENLALASPTDQDWYKFTVLRPADSINVQTLFKNAAGNIDLDVVGAGGRLLGRSATSKDREVVTLQNVQPGTYYVHVYGHLPETQPNNYRLHVDPGPGSKTRVFYVGNATSANQYYTTARGDDANDGTNFTKPKATLASLLAAHDLGPDDIVLFDTGTYAGAATLLGDDEGALYAGSPETSTLTGPGTRIALNDSDGNFFYNLTFGGTGGIGIDFQGDGVSDARDNFVLNSTFRVTGGTGIVVGTSDGNTIQDNRFVGSATGISLHARATATVEGNEISGAATGIHLESTGATIARNDIHHSGAGVAVNGRGVFGAMSMAAANDIHHNTTGVNVFSTASGAVVRFNKVRDNDTGIKTAGANSSIFGNEIFGNVTGLTGTGPLGPADWDNPNDVHHNKTGILGLASTDTVTTVVRFNRVHANETGIRLANGAVAQNNLVYRNTARGVLLAGAAGARVLNNTVYEPTADGVHIASGSSNARLRNNIVWTQAGYGLRVDLDSQAGFDSDYNNLFTSGSGKVGWWQKDFTDLYGWMVEVNSDNHSIGYTPLAPTLDDPRFLDAARDDFRVANFVSTNIDSGDPTSPFDLEPDPRGVRIDLGAYGNTPLASKAPASYVRVDSPNFYDDWEADEGHTIRWHTHNISGNVTIELYLAGGTRVATLGTVAASQGSFQWKPADSGIVGESSNRYRIRVSAGSTIGQSREGFSIPSAGGDFYLNDSVNDGDAFTTAAGNLRNTGKTPADPKTVLVGITRDYDLGPGDTVHADTGYYLHVRDLILSGNVAINDDEGVAITGPDDVTKVATFDRGGVAGGLPLSLVDGDSITLSHLTLAGGQYGVWVRTASVRFTGTYLTLAGNALDGIRLESDAVESTLHHLVALNNGRDGISVAVPLAALTDSVAHHNAGAGIRLVNVGAMRVQRNESYNNATGIDLDNATNLAPTLVGSADLAAGLGNKVHDNRADGIDVLGPAVVAGNTVYGHTSANQAGVVASYGAQVLSNVIFGNVDGVQLGWGPGAIGNNRIYDNRRYGISTTQFANAITGNVIYGNAVGLSASGSNFTFANNLVYGNREHGVSITAAGAGTQLRNNTFYQQSGDAVRVLNSSNPVALRNNILWAASGYALYFTKESQSGASSDYNLFYTTGSGKVGFWQNGDRPTFAAWRNASFLDAHSLFADPLFVNAAGGDFHEQSTGGSFHGGSLAPILGVGGLPTLPVGTFTADPANSPTLDRGRPTDPFAAEPAPNGAFVNLGAYGNTAQASKSSVPYVTVTNPDGGETLPANQTFAVEWRADSYTGTMDIELLHAGNAAVVLVVADNAPNTGSFAWRVPATLAAADDYIVRVTRNEATPLSDSSNAQFSIVPPIRAYYVNDGTFAEGDWTAAPGDDANDGLSPATPKASIRALLEAYQLALGDVIKVDAGRYPLTADILVTAADAGVKIEGYHDGAFPDRAAVIDRANPNTGFAFNLQGASGTTLDNLWITGSNNGIQMSTGAGSTDVTVSNNTLFGNYQHGLFVGPSNDRVTVVNNVAYGFPGGASADNTVIGIQVDSSGGTISGNTAYNFQNIGIYASGPGLNVTGNVAYAGGIGSFGLTGVGIQADGATAALPTTVSGNTVFNNAVAGILASSSVVISGNTVYGHAGAAGIRVNDAGPRVVGNSVFGNLDGISSTSSGTPFISGNRVYNNSRYGLHSQSTAATFSGNTVYSNGTGARLEGYSGLLTNNLIYANRTAGIVMAGGSGVRVLNNTVYQRAGDALFVDTTTNVTVRNNILWTEAGYVVRVGTTSQATFVSDYNTLRATGTGQTALWNNVAQPTLAAYQIASAQDLHSISDDPQFKNLAGGDGLPGYSSAAAGAPQILDDGAATLAGTWAQGTGRGFGNNYRSIVAGTSAASATWTFTGLTDGATYQLATTWPAVVGGGVVNATLTQGDRTLYGIQFNQSPLPNDFTDAGVPWELISSVVVSGTTLSVTLSRAAGFPALVDAVRLARLTGDGGVDDNFHVRPTSPTVDRGHPLSHAYAEPQPSGGRVNQGYDGNTPEGQTSPPQLVQVMSPNGGEKFNAGEAVNISWRSSGLTASRPVLLIDAGGGGVDNWLGDQFGTAYQRPAFPEAVDLSGVIDPAPMSLYQNFASANGSPGSAVSYRLPVPDGAYTLRLHFAEHNRAPGRRVFDIKINGVTVRSRFDVAAAAGGALKAIALSFPVTATGGAGVSIDLVTNNTNNEAAIVNGVELTAANPAGAANLTADVDLSTDNGATWNTIATAVPTDRFGRGSLTWTADAATSGFGALVRVRANASSGAGPEDVSDKPFLIAPSGRDYYVNDSGTDGDVFTTAAGDDDNDGKVPGRPMASISAVLDQYDLGPGDVIHVDTGVYNLLRNVLITANDAGVLIQGPDGNTAVIDRKNVAGFAFEVRGAAGVTLDHLAITGGRYGVWATAGSNNFTLSNSIVFANDERGVDVEGSDFATITGNEFYGRSGTATDQNNSVEINAARATISNNVVHNTPIGINVVGNNLAGNLVTVSGNTVYSNGAGIQGTQNVLVSGNTVYGNVGWGITIQFSSDAVGNVVFGNGDGVRLIGNGSSASGNRIFGNTRVGLLADGNSPLTGNVIYSNAQGISVATYTGLIANNLVYGNTTVGFALGGTGIAGNPPANILNNTVYQASGDAISVTPANLVRLRNNVIWAVNGSGIRVNGGDGFNFSSDYNTIVKGSGALARVGTLNGIGVVTLAEWQAEAQDVHSSGADPMFVDFNGPDDLLGYSAGVDRGGDDNFHVLPASPTIDAGDPQSYYLAEPAPNGSRANVGYDGNTLQASPTPAQAVQVLSPNGGERLTAGQPVTVTWRSSGLTVMRPVALINTGGGATGPFAADFYSAGGSARSTGRAVDLTGVTDPAPAAVYQTYTSAGGGGATLSYSLPVSDGAYTLRLHFVEPSFAAGSRRIDIRLNGTVVRDGFDIAAAAGGIGRATVLEFPVTAAGASGISLSLVARLTPGVPAIISGIEVLAADPGGVAAPAVDVDVSINNGLSWMPIASNVPLDRFGNGAAAWTPGPTTTTGATALVRVRATGGTRPEDTSDRPFFVPATGSHYYVNDASTAGDTLATAPGSLDNDGKSPARPMASLMALLEAYDLGPGDVVHVDAGTYRLLRDVTVFANDAGVRIEGPEAGVALFNRGSTAQTALGFEIRAAGVTISRLSVTGAYTGIHVVAGSNNVTLSNNTVFANDYRGIFVEAGSDVVTVADNTAYGVLAAEATNQNYGIWVSGTHSVITRNTAHDAGNSGIRLDALSGLVTDNEAYASDIGIELGRGGTETILVSGNVARNNRRYGIWADFTGKLISDNTAFGNSVAGILTFGNQVRGNLVYGNANGIVVNPGNPVAVVSGNRVFNNSGFGIQNADGANTIDGNTIYQNSVGFRANTFAGLLQNNAIHSNTNQGVLITASNGARLYNNTVYQPVGDAVSISGASSNVKVRNNILWTLAGYALNVAADSRTGFASDYNDLVRGAGAGANVGLWNGAAQATLVAWQAASGHDAHSLSADPKFLDLDGADDVLGYTNSGGGYDGGGDDNFQLAAGSPAIDHGDGAVAPAKDILGAGRADDLGTANGAGGFAEIGAFEFAGDSGDVTPPTVTGSTPAEVHAGGGTGALSQVTVTFSEPVDPIGAAAPANYELRGAGADGAFDTADDIVYSLAPQFTLGSRDVRLDIVGGTRASGLYRLTVHGLSGRGVRDVSGVLLDGDGNGTAGGNYVRQFTVTHRSSVVGRHLFYNNSAFDRPLTAADEPGDDDRAIAPDKSALLPGQLATFGNYSSYSKGINGLFIDMKDLPAGGTLTAADFVFKVGNGGNPAGWAAGPAPAAIVIRRGGGVGGSDRVVITFADGSIVNQWLEVTVQVTPNTNLSSPDVFYFGSLVGDTGDAASPLRVSVADLMDFRRVAAGSTATRTSRYDFNRDGKVNALDLTALRISLSRSLRQVTTQVAAAGAPPPAILPSVTSMASSGIGGIPRRFWEEPPPPTA